MDEANEGLSWIVCWTYYDLEDDYTIGQTYEEAKKLYDDLKADSDIYSVTLCAVVESTDYDPHPVFKESPTP